MADALTEARAMHDHGHAQPLSHLPAPAATPAAAAPPGTPTTHVGKYTLYETIGSGAFGKVKLGVNRETKERVAVKVMDKNEIREQDLSAQVRREIYIMRTLTHKHIVRMHEVLTSSTKLYIVMELVTGGELFERLQMYGRVNEALARRYFQQLVDGVDFCHKSGVAHRDLKPENLLLDEEGNIRITDFGFSSMKNVDVNAGLLYTQCGTPDYCAPEIIERADEGYNGAKVDVWSCGIILYALLVGRLPFRAEETDQLYDKILLCDVFYPAFVSPTAKDLLYHLLVRDPNSRFTLAEIKRHPWFLVDYTGDDARTLNRPAFYHKPGTSTRLRPSSSSVSAAAALASHTTATTSSSTPDGTASTMSGQARGPSGSPVVVEVRRGGSDSVSTAAGGRPQESPGSSGVERPGQSAAPRHPRERSFSTSANEESPEAHERPPTPGSTEYAPAHAPSSHQLSREAVAASSRDERRGFAESSQEPAPSPLAGGRVAALVRAVERQASPVDPTNPPPHAVFTRVMDRPATPASRTHPTQLPAPMSPDQGRIMLPSRTDPSKDDAPSPSTRPIDSRTAVGTTSSDALDSSDVSPESGAPPRAQVGCDAHASRSSRFENVDETPDVERRQEEPGSSRDHAIANKAVPGECIPNGASSDEDGSVEDYQSRPVPTLRLPSSERFGRHQTAQEISHQGTLGHTSVQRHRSDAGLRVPASSLRKSSPGSQHAPAHSSTLRSSSPSAAAVTGSIAARTTSPFRRQTGQGSGMSSPADPRAALLAGRATRFSDSPRQSSSPVSAGPVSKGQSGYRGQVLPQESTVPWHDNGSHAPSTQPVEDARHLQPGAMDEQWQSSPEGLSRRLWSVFSKWKAGATDEPMSPQHASPELRMEYRSIQTSLGSMANVGEKVAVFEQFMVLFGKDGLGDVASARGDDVDGEGYAGGRMPTDWSSEDDAGWSPMYEPIRHKSDLGKTRETSDLMTKWIGRYSGGLSGLGTGPTGSVHAGPVSREDSTDGPFGSDDGNISVDIADLQRLMRQQHSGRDDSNLAEELDRLMKGGDHSALDTVADSTLSSLNVSPPLDGSGGPTRASSAGPSGEAVAHQTRWSVPNSNMSAAVGIARNTRAVSHGDFPSEGSTDASGSTGASRVLPVSQSGPTSLASAPGRVVDTSSSALGSNSGTQQLASRKGGRKADMAASMGLDDVEYYGSDKRGVSTKLKGVFMQMKPRNQRTMDSSTFFQSGQGPDSILVILSLILTQMGASVQLKRETKRKLRCMLPMQDGVLHAVIELTVGENGCTTVAFRRSRYDRGRTDALAFHSFFETVRQQFIAEVQAQRSRGRPGSSSSTRRNGIGHSHQDHKRHGSQGIPAGSFSTDGPASIGSHPKSLRSRTPIGSLARSPDTLRMTPRAASDMR